MYNGLENLWNTVKSKEQWAFQIWKKLQLKTWPSYCMQLFTMSLNYPGLKLMIWVDFPEPGGKIQEAGQFHEFRQHSFMSSAATGDLSVHEMRCGQQFLQQESNILQAKNQGKKWYKIAFKSLLIPPCQVICSIPLIEFGLKSELHNNGLSAAHRAHCTAGAIKHMNSHNVQRESR